MEHPTSVNVLNEAAKAIAESMSNILPVWPEGTSLVREVDSRAIDELQAADIAAGWARELTDLGDPRLLASKFKRAYINGKIIDRLL